MKIPNSQRRRRRRRRRKKDFQSQTGDNIGAK
jgi:hypothetical protein